MPAVRTPDGTLTFQGDTWAGHAAVVDVAEAGRGERVRYPWPGVGTVGPDDPWATLAWLEIVYGDLAAPVGFTLPDVADVAPAPGLVAHLPGQHDQKTHGRGGGAGTPLARADVAEVVAEIPPEGTVRRFVITDPDGGTKAARPALWTLFDRGLQHQLRPFQERWEEEMPGAITGAPSVDDALDLYRDNGFGEVNRFLRSDPRMRVITPAEHAAVTLDAYFDDPPPGALLTAPYLALRGVDADAFPGKKPPAPGDRYVDLAPSSTTVNPDVASNFASDGGSHDGRLILRMQLPERTRVAVGEYEESEILVAPRTPFRVTAVTEFTLPDQDPVSGSWKLTIVDMVAEPDVRPTREEALSWRTLTASARQADAVFIAIPPDAVVAHLPGQHDQKTHGRKGGGVAPQIAAIRDAAAKVRRTKTSVAASAYLTAQWRAADLEVGDRLTAKANANAVADRADEEVDRLQARRDNLAAVADASRNPAATAGALAALDQEIAVQRRVAANARKSADLEVELLDEALAARDALTDQLLAARKAEIPDPADTEAVGRMIRDEIDRRVGGAAERMQAAENEFIASRWDDAETGEALLARYSATRDAIRAEVRATTLAVLAEVRQLGPANGEAFHETNGSTPELVAAANAALGYFPSEWVARRSAEMLPSVETGDTQEMASRGAGGDYSDRARSSVDGAPLARIRIREDLAGQPGVVQRIVVHEVAHSMQHRLSGIREAEVEYLRFRGVNVDARPDEMLSIPGSTYQSFPGGDVTAPYALRAYTQSVEASTRDVWPLEVFTVGVENLFMPDNVNAVGRDERLGDFAAGLMVTIP